MFTYIKNLFYKEKDMENALKSFLESKGEKVIQQHNIGFGITDIENKFNVYETKISKNLHNIFSSIGQVLCYAKKLNKNPYIVLDSSTILDKPILNKRIISEKPLSIIEIIKSLKIRILIWEKETNNFREL